MKSSDLTIERAQIEDLAVLNAISLASKRHWNYPDDWIENWKEDLKLTEDDFNTQTIFKAKVQNRIVGFCAFHDHAEYYEVTHLWVIPDFMGKGIGRSLIIHGMHHAVTEQKHIQVISDPNAEAFYQRLGFTTFDQMESYPIGRFLPVMKRET